MLYLDVISKNVLSENFDIISKKIHIEQLFFFFFFFSIAEKFLESMNTVQLINCIFVLEFNRLQTILKNVGTRIRSR